MVSSPKAILNKGALEAALSGVIANQSRFNVDNDVPTVEKLRTTEFGKTFNWNMRFLTGGSKYVLPSPFAEWFPAIDMDSILSSVTMKQIPGTLQTFHSIPVSRNERTFKFTFIDDAKGSIVAWLDDWMRFISGADGDDGITTLDEAARLVSYRKTNSTTSTVESRNLFIIPDGDLSELGNSSSELRIYSMNFIIVGEQNIVRPGRPADNQRGSTITSSKRKFTNTFKINPFG